MKKWITIPTLFLAPLAGVRWFAMYLSFTGADGYSESERTLRGLVVVVLIVLAILTVFNRIYPAAVCAMTMITAALGQVVTYVIGITNHVPLKPSILPLIALILWGVVGYYLAKEVNAQMGKAPKVRSL